LNNLFLKFLLFSQKASGLNDSAGDEVDLSLSGSHRAGRGSESDTFAGSGESPVYGIGSDASVVTKKSRNRSSKNPFIVLH